MNEEADRLLSGDYTVSAPYFLLLEFSNFLLRKRRKGELSDKEAREVQMTVLDCIDIFHSTDQLIPRANQISTEINHSPYDCLYLAAAESQRSFLITADRELYDRVRNSPYRNIIAWIEYPVL
ncbi:MAG: type II toxin-antitoxin system VapC family toxin [Candidatus Omnitrophota bacterium]